LQTLLTQLRRRHTAVEAEETLRAFEDAMVDAEAERNALADELKRSRDGVAYLVNLFSRIAVFNAKLAAYFWPTLSWSRVASPSLAASRR
jgi:hypothetical protein